MKLIIAFIAIILLTSCWPKSVSFVDGNLPDEWKFFSLSTLKSNAPNAPISYSAILSDAIKDGIQNGSRLKLASDPKDAQIEIDGAITSYSITPIALVQGDNATQNRLTISVKFNFYINAPEEDEMTLVSTRFFDYDASADLSSQESVFLDEINAQIVQDVTNKLLSNW
ncbi:MAG: LptE family protein [Flavobacteriales bacterium]|nr:LptE family protein [Flavobacteriales bacterium]